MGDPQFFKYPNLQLAQHIFNISNPAAPLTLQQSSLKSIQDAIRQDKMAPLYRQLSHPSEGVLNASGEGGSSQHPGGLKRQSSAGLSGMLPAKKSGKTADLPWVSKEYEALKAENDKELEAIQKEEDEALKKEGDTEVQAARAKRAEFWARVGDKVREGQGCGRERGGVANGVHRTRRSKLMRRCSPRPTY